MAHSFVGRIPRWLALLVVRACAVRPFQQLFYGAFYDALAGYFRADTGWHFMNYGFDSADFRDRPLPLRPEDDPDRLHIQLYDRLLSPISIGGVQVLEVGCGRGGGAAYVSRYLEPARMIGLDRSHKTIGICRTNHGDRGLHFLSGHAERLPFSEATFEVVINVESSHAYSSMSAFLGEVRRVLKPGGFLAFADLRWSVASGGPAGPSGLDQLKRCLRESGLMVVRESDISREVLQARTADDSPRRALIEKQVPRGLRDAFVELAGLPGSMMYRYLEDGTIVYWSALLQKP